MATTTIPGIARLAATITRRALPTLNAPSAPCHSPHKLTSSRTARQLSTTPPMRWSATVARTATSSAPSPSAAAPVSKSIPAQKPQSLQSGLSDQLPSAPTVPLETKDPNATVDWSRSFQGLSAEPFSKEVSDILLQPINEDDVEIKPDGIIYLPEIKYRRILNRSFGPGGWGLAPRGETTITSKTVTREYALIASGRLISVARGEMAYFDNDSIPTATEGCKSNALMRCCKDLGIASELWDPRWIRTFLAKHAKETWAEHVVTKKKRKIMHRKGDQVPYPYKATSA